MRPAPSAIAGLVARGFCMGAADVVPGYDGLSYNDLSAEVALPPEVLAEWLAALSVVYSP